MNAMLLYVFAGAAHRAGPDSMLILCEFVCEFEIIGRKLATSYDIARLLLMVPIEPWRNSTPFFGAVALCMTKIDNFSTMPHSGLKLNSMASSKR